LSFLDLLIGYSLSRPSTLERGGGDLDPCPSHHFYIDLSNDHIKTNKSNFYHDLELQNMVDSASNRNEYQEYFQGDKGGRCVRLKTLPPSCTVCIEIWEHQPPGALRACPGLYRKNQMGPATNRTWVPESPYHYTWRAQRLKAERVPV